MSTDSIRAALERLIRAYDEHGGRWPDHHVDALHNAVKRARADLAAEPPDPDLAEGESSDGHHTFAELYQHRHSLMLALMRALPYLSWFSQRHHDGELPFDSADWFIVGANLPTGAITYHLPIELLSLARQTGAAELSAGHPWDGHTASDVIVRLRAWVAAAIEPDPADGGEALLAATAAEGEDNAWERAKERAWDMCKIVGHQGELTMDDRGFDRAADLIRDEITLIRRVPAPAAEGDGQRSAVLEAVGKALGNAYDCLRVWEAWSVGTMGPDDFALVAEDDTRLAEIADAAIQAMRPATPAAPPKGELVAWLNNHAAHLRTMEGIGALPETELQERLDRAATLLQQQAAELAALRAGVVPVSERPWEREGWCDEEGQCWMGDPGGGGFIPSWRLCRPEDAPNMKVSLPAHAIPLPGPRREEVV